MRFWCQHGSMLAPTWAHDGSKKPSWRVLGHFGSLLGRFGCAFARLEICKMDRLAELGKEWSLQSITIDSCGWLQHGAIDHLFLSGPATNYVIGAIRVDAVKKRVGPEGSHLMSRCNKCCRLVIFSWPPISNALTGEKAKEISKSRFPVFPNFLGLVLGCIVAKFCK